MKSTILPSWALRSATTAEREKAADAYYRSKAKTVFRDRKKLRSWIEYHGWKTSWLHLEDSFYKELFSNDEFFKEGLEDGVVEIFIPKESYTFSDEEFKNINDGYSAREFNWVVEYLREIRRAIEAGILVEIDGLQLKSEIAFYNWVDKQFHILEEVADKWIGNDD